VDGEVPTDPTPYCAAAKYFCECEGTWTCSTTKNVCEQACAVDADCNTTYTTSGEAVCDGTKCVECLTVDDCGSTFGGCVQNRCVQCDADADCGDGQTCEGNVCTVRECYTDAHCDVFEKCNSAGRCVEDDCTTDRECAEYLDNGIAKCLDGECRVPCVTDAECNTQVGGSAPYYDQLCADGFCVQAGCSSAADCRARAGVGNQGNYSCE
jgi:hypothetical protein